MWDVSSRWPVNMLGNNKCCRDISTGVSRYISTDLTLPIAVAHTFCIIFPFLLHICLGHSWVGIVIIASNACLILPSSRMMGFWYRRLDRLGIRRVALHGVFALSLIISIVL